MASRRTLASTRTPTEVIQDHLVRRLQGDVEGDIVENFASDILILSSFGMFTGHDGVRESAAKLADLVGDAAFHYNRTLIQRDFAFLDWSARSEEIVVCDGADSFHIKDGKIAVQTIHYTVHQLR